MVEMEQRHHQEPLNLISEVENWGFTANYLDREPLT